MQAKLGFTHEYRGWDEEDAGLGSAERVRFCSSLTAKSNTDLTFGFREIALLFQLFKIRIRFGLQG
jgi:hypothetical protein